MSDRIKRESSYAGPLPTSGSPRGSRRSKGQTDLNAAIVAAKAGDLAAALSKCRASIQKDAKLEHAHLLAGSICGMQRNLDCERDAYDVGLRALPESAELLKARALVHLQDGEHEDAVKKYERALAVSTVKSAETLADLAYAYVYVDRLTDAKALASRATALDPKCFSCWMAAGQVHLSSREFGDATLAFARARSIAPTDPDARRSEAKARFLAGDVVKAADLFEALVRDFPDDERLRMLAAQVAMKAERFGDAVRHFEMVLQRHPNEEKLLRRLAEAQRKAGDEAAANATLRRVSRNRER